MESMKAMKPMAPMEPMKPMDFGTAWWPNDLGEPSTSGAQNGGRYAFFPDARRLLIEDDGKLTTYDTASTRSAACLRRRVQDATSRSPARTVR